MHLRITRRERAYVLAVAALPLLLTSASPSGTDVEVRASLASAPAAFEGPASTTMVPGTLTLTTPAETVSAEGAPVVVVTTGSGDLGESPLGPSGAGDIPPVAMTAYTRAAEILAEVDPTCQLSWSLLAAIGKVESDHGRHGGAILGADGVSSPVIVGPALDGVGPVARIRDTDDGTWDQDDVWDRAVGPMQFIPQTWTVAGADGDADGIRSPHDIDDAALAAAVYLCFHESGLDAQDRMRAALLHYNHSSTYASLVLAYERAYRLGGVGIPTGLAVLPSADSVITAGLGVFAGDRTALAPDHASARQRRKAIRAAEVVSKTHPTNTAPDPGDPSTGPTPAGAPGWPQPPGGSPTPSPDGSPTPDSTPGSPSAGPSPGPSPSPSPPPGATPSETPAETPDQTPSDTPSSPPAEPPAQEPPAQEPPAQEPPAQEPPSQEPSEPPSDTPSESPSESPTESAPPSSPPSDDPGTGPSEPPGGNDQPAQTPTTPAKSGSPGPDKPVGPGEPLSAAGLWQTCGDSWCLGTDALDLGDDGLLDSPSPHDLDGDGVTRTRRTELAGLVGSRVTITYRRGASGWVVLTVNDLPYREPSPT